MKERATHTVNVKIGQNVVVDSEVSYGNYSFAMNKERELFESVLDAKQKLDSSRNLYQKFDTGYTVLSLAEIGFLFASTGKVIIDLLQNGDAVGGDILRIFGIIVIGTLSITAGSIAQENKTKSENKLSAVEQAEASRELSLRKTYPFV